LGKEGRARCAQGGAGGGPGPINDGTGASHHFRFPGLDPGRPCRHRRGWWAGFGRAAKGPPQAGSIERAVAQAIKAGRGPLSCYEKPVDFPYGPGRFSGRRWGRSFNRLDRAVRLFQTLPVAQINLPEISTRPTIGRQARKPYSLASRRGVRQRYRRKLRWRQKASSNRRGRENMLTWRSQGDGPGRTKSCKLNRQTFSPLGQQSRISAHGSRSEPAWCAVAHRASAAPR